FPIGFNILDVKNPKYKVIAASGVVSVFKKIFGDSWGPRLEYWLSSAVLALLDYPGATLMMLPRLFTDDAFRDGVIEKIDDPVIKARWVNEYNKLDQRQRAETISPILNKVGQFLSSSLVRNIVAQPTNGFDLREVLDQKKIFLVKLSKGLIGEDNAALLGAMLVTQIQLAAMSRADETDQEKRADFFLYVDEFQNFATDSFAAILSEARKYRLSLTLAHQFMAQLPDTVINAVLGNVGTIVSFRVGADDAAKLMREFAPVFDEQDLVNLNVFNIYIKLSIDGLTPGPFSAATLPPSAPTTPNYDKVLENTREMYAQKLSDVKGHVDAQTAALTGVEPAPSYPRKPAGKGGGGFNKSGPRPGGGTPGAFGNKKKPNINALQDLLHGIKKKTAEPLAPNQQEELAKTMLNDLKGETGNSFKDAFSKAQAEKKQVQQSEQLKKSVNDSDNMKDVDQDIKDFMDDQTGGK
ncbi:MAG: type IV secretory system conjugative DNA transfer family protein, partial [Patescibacteria group bacterium]